MGFLSNIFKSKPNPLIEIMAQGATIIDVRTAAEFKYGHVQGSINIPLDQVQHKIKKIQKMKTPLVFCCASGSRSASATSLLKSKGMQDVYNGRTWQRVNRFMPN